MKRVLSSIFVVIVVAAIIAIVILRDPNEFWIIEEDFSHEFSGKPLELDERQLRSMAEELIQPFKQERGAREIVVSQAQKKSSKLKIKRFKGFLQQKLPGNWNIVGGGRPDLIVAGYFFHQNSAEQTPALFLFLIEWNTGKVLSATANYPDSKIATACEELIRKLREHQETDLKVEVINQLQDSKTLSTALTMEKMVNARLEWMKLLASDIRRELAKKLRDEHELPKTKAEGALIITGDPNRITLELSKLSPYYEMLTISTSYSNNKIANACENLIENLSAPQGNPTIASLKVAAINASRDAHDSVTALTLEKMVDAKMPGMTLLGRRYSDKYGIQLRKAWEDGGDISENAKEVLRDASERIAVLSIEQDSDGVFLELTRLPDRKLLATSAPRPIAIHIDSKPEQARILMISPNEIRRELGLTPKSLDQERIKKYNLTHGTKFILERSEENSRTYTHPSDAEREREIDGDTIYYNYYWYGPD